MDIDLIFKIAAVGIIVSILNQVLVRSGREEQATMTSLAALVVVLMIVVQRIAELFDMVKTLMETVGKLIAAALICCALNLLLRKQAPELTLALCAVVCALCFLTVLPFFSPVLAFVRRLEEITGLSQAVFAPLFKTAAIGLLSQLAGTLCRDSGQQALGQTIEICSGFLCIYLALPLLEMVLSLLQTMIGG